MSILPSPAWASPLAAHWPQQRLPAGELCGAWNGGLLVTGDPVLSGTPCWASPFPHANIHPFEAGFQFLSLHVFFLLGQWIFLCLFYKTAFPILVCL